MQGIDRLIETALGEDIGSGDITTEILISRERKGRGFIRAKESMVVAGLDVARRVFAVLDPSVSFHSPVSDGDSVVSGDLLLQVEGSLRALLTGERTALNFLQHLSGISTFVRACVEEIAGTGARLVDTRKTTPGLRMLEKYAVRAGGGRNHRTGLFDGILIKDNHIAVSGGIKKAVEKARSEAAHLLRIEVEAADMDGVKEALEARADVIMLDNMTPETMEKAVALIDGRAVVEASGGVTLESLRRIALTGVDIISSGALTNSAGAVDINMEIEPV